MRSFSRDGRDLIALFSTIRYISLYNIYLGIPRAPNKTPDPRFEARATNLTIFLRRLPVYSGLQTSLFYV